jgi:hypothetical protein
MPQHFIETVDDPLIYERMEAFGGGMDAFTRSSLLPTDTCQYLENFVIPDNLELRTRPGADVLGSALPATIRGMAWFSLLDGATEYNQLLAVSNGTVHAWDGNAWTVTNADPIPDRDVAMAQGMDKMLLSDGVGSMLIYDGTGWTACTDGPLDPPVGATILCYHTGRMFAAGFDGGDAGKETDAIWASEFMSVGNGNWTSERQFRIGKGEGDAIVAMASLQQNVMAVLKGNSVWLVRCDPANSTYEAGQAVESISSGIGCVGRRAFCVFGNDLLFMARDGVRSLQRMEAAASQFQVSAPLSRPVQPLIDRINWEYASTICAVKHREYALFAVPLDSAIYPDTVLVWNGRLEKWVGVWTGWSPMAFCVTHFNDTDQLAIGQYDGKVRKWKLENSATDDATYQEDGTFVQAKANTRSFLFGEPINDKDGNHTEIRFAGSNGVINLTLVSDDADVKSWNLDVQPANPVLPQDLPFTLVNPVNTPKRNSLRGLPAFSECYLQIEGQSGWFSIRNLTLSAFLNTLASQ